MCQQQIYTCHMSRLLHAHSSTCPSNPCILNSYLHLQHNFGGYGPKSLLPQRCRSYTLSWHWNSTQHSLSPTPHRSIIFLLLKSTKNTKCLKENLYLVFPKDEPGLSMQQYFFITSYWDLAPLITAITNCVLLVMAWASACLYVLSRLSLSGILLLEIQDIYCFPF